MKIFDPEVGKSLQAILDNQDPDLETKLGLNFTYTYESWGVQKVEDLKENGSNIWVNQ